MNSPKNRLLPQISLNARTRLLASLTIIAGATILALFFFFKPVGGLDGGYADQGTGTYNDHIFWMTWENGDLADGVDNGDSKTFTLPGGLVLTATFSQTTGQAKDFVPTDMDTWSGSIGHNFYQVSGSNGEALYGGSGDDGGFQINFSATLDGAPYTPPLIFLDPESTDGAESLEVRTNGTDWEIIEELAGGSVALSLIKPKLARIDNGSNKLPVLLTRAADQFDVEIVGGGRQGVSFGIWFSTDYGDAPDSYTTQNSSAGPRHLVDPMVPLYLGSQVDAETDASASGTGMEDNNDGANDEDGINFPAKLDVIGGYTLDKSLVTVTNQTGSAASLHAWIDFNHNGVFELGEYAVTTVANNPLNGNPDGDLVWSGIGDGVSGNTYARFRLSTDPAINGSTPGGLALDGEVEDYAIAMTNISLPVEWLGMDAEWVGENVHVNWLTARESNTDYFKIERQIGNSGLYEPIGEQKAAGFSEEPQRYQTVDTQLPDGARPQALLYRIKQVDFDGKFSYSNQFEVQGLPGGSALRLLASPNPASSHINIQLITPPRQESRLWVTDVSGRKVFDQSIGDEKNIRLDVSGWPRGSYVLSLGSGEAKKIKRILLE